ncbi:hypothetical protein BDY21DRAFT_362121 [Lineolata rhizophorae]|uniref:Uncharacterized protein n=1 Tax=Lineolata rhizophorae TaxID=578093 RepID=A0A6A6P5V2_9PEZI|nr:hypothetical protein BDY21DRAFT_362121 [Lineolata rhizophorae]
MGAESVRLYALFDYICGLEHGGCWTFNALDFENSFRESYSRRKSTTSSGDSRRKEVFFYDPTNPCKTIIWASMGDDKKSTIQGHIFAGGNATNLSRNVTGSAMNEISPHSGVTRASAVDNDMYRLIVNIGAGPDESDFSFHFSDARMQGRPAFRFNVGKDLEKIDAHASLEKARPKIEKLTERYLQKPETKEQIAQVGKLLFEILDSKLASGQGAAW